MTPGRMGGKPCIRDTRVTVGTVVGLVPEGHTPDEIVEAYPYLEREDVQAALRYAAWRSEETGVVLRALQQFDSELKEGAILSIDPERARLQYLPLKE